MATPIFICIAYYCFCANEVELQQRPYGQEKQKIIICLFEKMFAEPCSSTLAHHWLTLNIFAKVCQDRYTKMVNAKLLMIVK